MESQYWAYRVPEMKKFTPTVCKILSDRKQKEASYIVDPVDEDVVDFKTMRMSRKGKYYCDVKVRMVECQPLWDWRAFQ